MAKRQKSIRDHFFEKSREMDSAKLLSSTCESTKSANSPQSVFATIVEEGVPVTIFLGLLQIEGSKKDANVIYDTLISHLRSWGLDLCKFVAFGSDRASTMVGCQDRVATRIRTQRCRLGTDLEEALAFQRSFAENWRLY
jgi:hypothetical protein